MRTAALALALALTLLVGLAIVSSSLSVTRSGEVAPVGTAPCPAARIHNGRAPRRDLNHLPWIAAGTRTRQITGYLFYYREALNDPRVKDSNGVVIYAGGELPDGKGSTKILWVARRPGAGLVVAGSRLDGEGSFRQRFNGVSGGAFPSILDVPVAGCWRLTLRTGRITARLTVLAIDPASSGALSGR